MPDANKFDGRHYRVVGHTLFCDFLTYIPKGRPDYYAPSYEFEAHFERMKTIYVIGKRKPNVGYTYFWVLRELKIYDEEDTDTISPQFRPSSTQ